jgi:hypothetical protein
MRQFRGKLGIVKQGSRMEIEASDKKRFFKKFSIDHHDECWRWRPPLRHDGYGQMYIRSLNRPVASHRVSYMAYYGEIPDGKCVLHHCDNPACVNPYHLFLGTQLDNIADMNEKGRARGPRGHLAGRAKLKPKDIPKIRELLASGVALRKIGDEYGVSHTCIARIKNSHSWIGY